MSLTPYFHKSSLVKIKNTYADDKRTWHELLQILQSFHFLLFSLRKMTYIVHFCFHLSNHFQVPYRPIPMSIAVCLSLGTKRIRLPFSSSITFVQSGICVSTVSFFGFHSFNSHSNAGQTSNTCTTNSPLVGGQRKVEKGAKKSCILDLSAVQ